MHPEILENPVGFGLHTVAKLRFKRMILNADGTVAKETEWANNLILDAGLDGIATQFWANANAWGHIGTGTNPFFRDSGLTTFTSTGTSLVSNAAFFEAADVGRLFKPDSGTEVYITAFTNTTTVTTSADPGAAAVEGTVYYVARTLLQTELKRTATVRTSGGDNSTIYNSTNRTFTHRRTHVYSAEVGPVTYRELGWGFTNVAALFSGVVLSGAGDSLIAGQQYMVISELILTPSPTVTVAAPDVGSGGWNTAGNINIESQGAFDSRVFSKVGANGGFEASNGMMEPAWTQVNQDQISAFLATFTLQSPMAALGNNFAPPADFRVSSTVPAYVAGQFRKDRIGLFSVSVANGTWHGVGILEQGNRVLSVKFTTTQTKTNTHTVTVTFRVSWQRTLVN